MHKSYLELQHPHSFLDSNRQSSRKITLVIIINALVMVAEIVAGMVFGSMALTADGWHMGTHILALGISLIAYHFANRYIQDTRFAFGTWKIEILGGYTSAIMLGVVGCSMCFASVERLMKPVPIHYEGALVVAIIGLIVNIAGALILGHDTTHNHAHDHGSDAHPHDRNKSSAENHSDHHHDLNLRAAYIHVITDALTSVLAIIALILARYFGWNFIDPVVGILGGVLILKWTVGLLRATGSVLLDKEDNSTFSESVRDCIESDGHSKISDLHVWKIAANKYACIIVLATPPDGYTIADFRQRLAAFAQLVHVTIELHYIPG